MVTKLWTRYGIGGAGERALIAGVSCRTRDETKTHETKYKNCRCDSPCLNSRWSDVLRLTLERRADIGGRAWRM